MPTRVMFCGTGWFDIINYIEKALLDAGVDAIVMARDPARPLADQLRDAEVALPSNAPFGEHEFSQAPSLRLVQQPAVGYEGIDLASARKRAIPVCNAPATNTDAVAQAALFLILALARKFPQAQRSFQQAHVGHPVGIELTGKHLGIVGLGKSGSRLAHAATALGMHTHAVRSADPRSALLQMLSQSDVVSIHCPLTPSTRSLFDDEAFSAMKPGAWLINVARGPIVDRSALDKALLSGHLGGLGLDVFWQEPWNPLDPLFAHDHVIALPHVAGSTQEAFGRIASVVAHNIHALLLHQPLVHRVDTQNEA